MKLTAFFNNLYTGEHNSEKVTVDTENEYEDKNIRLAFFTPGGKNYVSGNLEMSEGKADYYLPARLTDCPGTLYTQILVFDGDSFIKKSRVYEYKVLPSADFHTCGELTDDGLLTLGKLDEDMKNYISSAFTYIDTAPLSMTNGELKAAADRFFAREGLIFIRNEDGVHPVTDIYEHGGTVTAFFEYIAGGTAKQYIYKADTASDKAEELITLHRVTSSPLERKTQAPLRKNSRIFSSQIVSVARSYYNARGVSGDYKFSYSTTGCFDERWWNNKTNGIDCSTFIGLVLRGIPYHLSPYYSVMGGTANDDDTESTGADDGTDTSESTDGAKDITRNLSPAGETYPWAVNPGEYIYPVNTDGTDIKAVRTASQIGQWMYDMGYSVPFDNTFIDVEPGDIIFWAKKKSSGQYVQPDRFRKISHVAICSSKIYVDDYNRTTAYYPGEYTYHNDGLYRCIRETTGVFDTADWNYTGPHRYRHGMLEVTTGNAVVLNRTLERTYPDKVVMICRPDLGSMKAGEYTGNITSQKGITNLDDLTGECFTYLTADITGGLPSFIRNISKNGTGYAVKTECTYLKNGTPYSVIQTLTDTRHNNDICVRTKYLYRNTDGNIFYIRPDDPAAAWTEWSLLINKNMLDTVMAANDLGLLKTDSSGNWYVEGGRHTTGTGTTPVNADWNAVSGAAEILNKPVWLNDTEAVSGTVPVKHSAGTTWDFLSVFYGWLQVSYDTQAEKNAENKADLNADTWWTDNGRFFATDTNAADIMNMPINKGGLLLVMNMGGLGSAYKRQVYIPRDSECRIYMRYRSNDKINGWRVINTTAV